MDPKEPSPESGGRFPSEAKGDPKAAESAFDKVMSALKGDANASRDIQKASEFGYNAPLQLKRAHKAKPQGMPVTTRLLNFIRRNAGVVAFGVFIYVEFIGFPVLVATSKEKEGVVAIRKRWNHAVAASRAYVPPVKDTFVTRTGAFSLVDKEISTEVVLPNAVVERPPYSTRLYNYLASYVPHPFYSCIDNSPEGANTLQYNWLLYFPQEYTHRKTTLLPIDAITSDGTTAVHAAIKICYRTDVWRHPEPARRAFSIKQGEADALLDNVAANEIEKWIKNAKGFDVHSAPRKRIVSHSRSLGGLTEPELRASVLASAEELRKVRENEITAAASGSSDVDPQQLNPVDTAKILDAEETLRRIWATNMTARLRGRAIIEDITWKMTLTDLNTGTDMTKFDPSIASNWTI